MNFYLRQVISNYPHRIKLVHRHFPMDSRFNPILKTPFHEGAGIMALIAIYAKTQGKFWEVNDYLFNIAGKDMRVDLNKLAEQMGIESSQLNSVVNESEIRQILIRDIRQGLKLGLTGTPSYVIGDQVYHGLLPTEVFHQIRNTDS
jgi:protein-disulfide isomerase